MAFSAKVHVPRRALVGQGDQLWPLSRTCATRVSQRFPESQPALPRKKRYRLWRRGGELGREHERQPLDFVDGSFRVTADTCGRAPTVLCLALAGDVAGLEEAEKLYQARILGFLSEASCSSLNERECYVRRVPTMEICGQGSRMRSSAAWCAVVSCVRVSQGMTFSAHSFHFTGLVREQEGGQEAPWPSRRARCWRPFSGLYMSIYIFNIFNYIIRIYNYDYKIYIYGVLLECGFISKPS